MICSKIQLFDNHVAQKYKCDTAALQLESSPESDGANKTTIEKPTTSIQTDKHPVLDSNALLNNPDAFDAHGSIKMTPVSREHQFDRQKQTQQQQQRLKHSASTPRFPSAEEPVSASKPVTKRVLGHKRQSSTASATNFQPGHKRGPSTLTQITMTTDTQTKSENLDLYHWILRAQKEHKQRQIRAPETQEASYEINPMELMLSVFFWPVYEVSQGYKLYLT